MQVKGVARRDPANLSEAENIYQRLSNCHSVAWLGHDRIRELAHSCKLIEARAGRLIYSAEEPRTHLYILLSGCVTVRYGESQAVARVLGPGDFLGFASLFGAARYNSSAVATLNSRIARLPAARFVEIALGIPPDRCMKMLSATFGLFFRQMESYPIASKNLRTRVAFELLNLAEKFGVADARGTLLNLPLTHRLIADLVAASRPRVSLAMMELERIGCVTRANQRFIVNVEALRTLLRERSRQIERTGHRAAITPLKLRPAAPSNRHAKA
jgi:CRP-like cAMP-binding protein